MTVPRLGSIAKLLLLKLNVYLRCCLSASSKVPGLGMLSGLVLQYLAAGERTAGS